MVAGPGLSQMKRGKTRPVKASGERDEVLAVLIANTLSKKRPLSLPEISVWLKKGIQSFGSFEQLAERLGISAKMLRQFSYVDNLSPSVLPLFTTRRIDSVDAATHLGMLPKQDQCLVANA